MDAQANMCKYRNKHAILKTKIENKNDKDLLFYKCCNDTALQKMY